MANEPALDKVMFSFQISVAEKIRMEKEAARLGHESLSDYVRYLIHKGVKNVELTAEDHEEIARQIRKNQAARDRKRVG